jgi:hypothetical protein
MDPASAVLAARTADNAVTWRNVFSILSLFLMGCR